MSAQTIPAVRGCRQLRRGQGSWRLATHMPDRPDYPLGEMQETLDLTSSRLSITVLPNAYVMGHSSYDDQSAQSAS